MFSLHTKARQGGVGKAGTVRELLHATDVTHWLLPLPQGRGRDLHLVLLIWEGGRVKRSAGLECFKGYNSNINREAGLFYLER